MSGLTREGTAEPVSRDQILRREQRQENAHFPCSADHEQDWQPYLVDPYSAICHDHIYSTTSSTVVNDLLRRFRYELRFFFAVFTPTSSDGNPATLSASLLSIPS